MKSKVFLGGSRDTAEWRKTLIPMIGRTVDFFNPVVGGWSEEIRLEQEIEKRDFCNVHLYVVDKHSVSILSIAEAIQSSNDGNKITIFQVMPHGLHFDILQSLDSIIMMLKENGAIAYRSDDIKRAADIINRSFEVTFG